MHPQQRVCFRVVIASGALAAPLLPSAALATYSIAATDSQSQEVGGAITSCVGSLDVGIVYGSLPGVGVIHAQAQLDQRGRAKMRALELLEQGSDPTEIITEITRRELDQSFASRQYGIVDLRGRAAGFTGEQAQAYKNDQQGMFGTFTYSVQGNILTSQAVLDQATDAFQQPACDLAERLMRALEAGAENGEGDSRCTGNDIPADSAFIQVDRPGQSEPYLHLSIAGTRPNNPLPRLRDMFDDWRRSHPCPATSIPAAGSGGVMSGTGSAGTTSAAGSGSPSSAAGTGATATEAAGSGGITAAGGAGAQAPSSAAGSASPGLNVAGTSAAGSGASATPGRTVPTIGNSLNSAGAPSSPTNGSAGAATAAATSDTPTSTTHGIEQAPQSADGGCTATPGRPRTGGSWIAAAAFLWLALGARRRVARSYQSKTAA